MLITNNIIRSATRDKDSRLTCVVICRENETFFESLAKLDCDFYVIRHPGLSDWKNAIANKPDNIHVIDDLTDLMGTPIDFAICNDRLQEFDLGYQLSSLSHVPLVLIDHVSSAIKQKLPLFASVGDNQAFYGRPSDINVSLSDNIKESWSSNMSSISITIPPLLEESYFDYDLSSKQGVLIDNNIPQEAVNVVANVFNRKDCTFRYVDDTSYSDPKGYRVYINTWNNIDTKALQAMAAGCIVISPKNKETESLIEHEKNGLLFDGPQDLYELVDKCLSGNYSDIVENSVAAAKEMSCNEETFLKKWNQVLSYISGIFYIRKQ